MLAKKKEKKNDNRWRLKRRVFFGGWKLGGWKRVCGMEEVEERGWRRVGGFKKAKATSG